MGATSVVKEWEQNSRFDAELLRRLLECGVDELPVGQRFAVFLEAFGESLFGFGEFGLSFRGAAEPSKDAAAEQASAAGIRVQTQRGIHFAEGVLVFVIVEGKLGELHVRTSAFWVQLQRFFKGRPGLFRLADAQIQNAELLVVVGKVGFDRDILAKFGFGFLGLALHQVSHAEFKVDVGEIVLASGSFLQFVDGLGHILAIQAGLAHQQVKFRSIAGNADHLLEDFVVELFLAGSVGGDVEQI